MKLFNQFMSPTLFKLPLLIIAMTTPLAFFPKPSLRWLSNPVMITQDWLIIHFVKKIFQPLKPENYKWAPLFIALTLLLTTLNMLGLLPYTFTPTTQLSMNLAFSIPLWMVTILIGFNTKSTMALAHFLPRSTPTLLAPILIIIETISLLIQPFALAIRLMANLTAGHLLIQLISMAILFLMPISLSLATMILILLLLLTILEGVVAVIQAYVFVLLLSIYLQENS